MEYRNRSLHGETKLLLILGVIFLMINCGHACKRDTELSSPCTSEQDSRCKNGKCHSSNRIPHTKGSLAAVVSVCSILMLCFWGLLCFACYKQCKECRGGHSSEFSSSTINSITLDFTSIDIPEDFIRNSRIPSVEEYSGPPPYLCLFNPLREKEDSHEFTEDHTNCAEKKNSSEDTLPPSYKSLFANGPPLDYHEVVYHQTSVV